MKKILCIILAFCLLTSLLTACTPGGSGATTTTTEAGANPDNTKIRIGVLSGPTAMGALKLWSDNDPRYEFTLYSSPDLILPDIVAGKLDIAALPTNNAAAFYNSNGKDTRVIALNTLGVLYLLDATGTVQSLADLEGKTVYVPNAGSNPEYILRHILNENGINATVETSIIQPTAIQQGLLAGTIEIAVLPQPAATATVINAKTNKNKTIASFDLSAEWNKIEDTPIAQGCLLASADFLAEHPAAVEAFLENYAASVAYMTNAENLEAAADLVVAKEILPKAPIAQQALPKCAITYVDGAEMKETLAAFYQILYSYAPQSIGGAIPDNGFYYGAE